jgi:hypothetical protein
MLDRSPDAEFTPPAGVSDGRAPLPGCSPKHGLGRTLSICRGQSSRPAHRGRPRAAEVLRRLGRGLRDDRDSPKPEIGKELAV